MRVQQDLFRVICNRVAGTQGLIALPVACIVKGGFAETSTISTSYVGLKKREITRSLGSSLWVTVAARGCVRGGKAEFGSSLIGLV